MLYLILEVIDASLRSTDKGKLRVIVGRKATVPAKLSGGCVAKEKR
jgi:hypothetical protein